MSKTSSFSSREQSSHDSGSTSRTAWNKKPSVGSWLLPSLKKSAAPPLPPLQPSLGRTTCRSVLAKAAPKPQCSWSRVPSVGTWFLPAPCRSVVPDSGFMPPLHGASPARPSQHIPECTSRHQAAGTSWPEAFTVQATEVNAGEGLRSLQVSPSLAETLREPACGQTTLRPGSYSLLAHSELEARVASLILTGGRVRGGSQSSSSREQLPAPSPSFASLRDALPPALPWTPLRGEDSTAQLPQTPKSMPVPLPPRLGESLKPVRRSFRRQSRPRDVLCFPIDKGSNVAICSNQDVTCSEHPEQMQKCRTPLVRGGDSMTGNHPMMPRTGGWSAEWTSQNSMPFRYRFTRGSLTDDSAQAMEAGHQASGRGSDGDATDKHEQHEQQQLQQQQQKQSSTLRLPPVQLGGQHRSMRFVAPASGVLSAHAGSLRQSHRCAASLASSIRAQSFDR